MTESFVDGMGLWYRWIDSIQRASHGRRSTYHMALETRLQQDSRHAYTNGQLERLSVRPTESFSRRFA